MKQTAEMKQAAFVELMHDNGFQYLGATARDGQFIYERTWRHTVPVAFYSEQERTGRSFSPTGPRRAACWNTPAPSKTRSG